MATEAAESKEKLKVLQLAIDKIEKTYGKGTIMRMGDDAIDQVESISTGSIALDMAFTTKRVSESSFVASFKSCT